MSLRKADLEERRQAWAYALEQIARELGKDHPITKGMGSVAWGRYEGEPQVSGDGIAHVAQGYGFLQGVRYALLQVARAEGWEGERELAKIHDRMRGEK